VDLDRAISGVAANLDVLTRLHVDHPDVRIQASGGIVTLEDARAAIASGAARVVLGSAILRDRTAALRLLRDLGPAAIVGIEVEDGRIRGRGIGRVDLELDPTIEWLGAIGAPGLLVTAVTRVGGLGGPDLATLARVIRPEFPTLAAGGIASLADLRAVRDLGAAGAVVGRAAVEGELDLAAALAWAAG
jgi:phosphoribosylformimino-5-aminoimidazole carboxamide ribonucleotide (ProFAR) isomerase